MKANSTIKEEFMLYLQNEKSTGHIFKSILFIPFSMLALTGMFYLSAVGIVKLKEMNFSLVAKNIKPIVGFMQGFMVLVNTYTKITPFLIVIVLALAVMKLIAILKGIIDVSDMLSMTRRKSDKAIILNNGYVIGISDIVYDLHFGSFKAFLKSRKIFNEYRKKVVLLRLKELEGMLKLISHIESGEKGYNKNSLFRAASHLITDHTIEFIGGIEAKDEKQLGFWKKVSGYISIVIMILLGTAFTPSFNLKELSPKRLSWRTKTCYFFGRDLIGKRDVLMKRLEKTKATLNLLEKCPKREKQVLR